MLALYYHLKTKKDRNGIVFDEYYKKMLKNINFSSEDDLTTKCRICLQEGTVAIYGNDYTEEIVRILERLSNIILNEDDSYPKHLCTVCYKFIKTAVWFHKTAKHTEELLKQPVKEEVIIIEQTDDHRETSGSSIDNTTNQQWAAQDILIQRKKRTKYPYKVACSICNKVVRGTYYEHHLLAIHSTEPKFVCDVCGKTFKYHCAFYTHSRMHNKGFAYKCQFCPYRGGHKELLRYHMRSHTGDYKHKCTECPAKFLTKSNLNKHALRHKEPTFQCDLCEKGFYTKPMVQKHLAVDHLGIKKHVCSICGKAFGYRNAMMKHQLRVHKRKKLPSGRLAYLKEEQKSE